MPKEVEQTIKQINNMLFSITNAVLKSVNKITEKVAECVLEYKEDFNGTTYTNEILLKAFKENIQKATELLGCYVDAKFSIRMNEYNGRNYNNISVFSIDAHRTDNWSDKDKRTGEQMPQKAIEPVPAVSAPMPAAALEPKDGDLPF